MRRLVDVFVVLTVVAVVVFVVQSRRSVVVPATAAADVQQSLAQLYERAAYYGALDKSTQTTRTLWPVAIMPKWFGDTLPVNTMLPGVASDASHRVVESPRPWIDVAPPGDDAPHPPDPVAVRRDQAQFWYNPNIGVFRARVPADLGEDQALSLYNQLNGVEVAELHRDTNPNRVPLAYLPGTTPSASLASREPASTPSVAPSRPAPGTATGPTLFMSDRRTSDPPASHAAVEVASEPAPPAPRTQGRSRFKDQAR